MKKVWMGALLAVSMLVITCTVTKNTSSLIDDQATERRPVIANPTAVYLSPEESMKTMQLPKGYHVELVASEPMIKEPVAIAWDGDAKMYVAEMLTYMQDADFTGEQQPRSRISLLEDTDNDGKMDKSTVFIDSLLLPRMILCVNHELLVNESNTINIWNYTDTNGDGKADQKKLAYRNDKYVVNDANMEHQRSGLDWNLDNWIYLTYDPVRFRYKKGMLKADTLASGPGGQWGVTHDDYGRMYFSRAGGEVAAMGFQINPAYGALDFADQYSAEFAEVWPIIATPDVQGGLIRLRPDSTLNHFTAACGQSIFRGDRLPQDMMGDYLVCEPVARCIRQAEVINLKGKRVLQNTHYRQEFMASSDMNFRPINTYTGPDGCLYVVDMHRGIIQQGNWTRPGSFLRSAINYRGLDKNIGHGRIYRIVHDGFQRGTKPTMLQQSSRQLVTYLNHPNGWWRDNAQKQLIALGDASVVPALKQIATGQQGPVSTAPSALARIHALWTLEGMEALDKETVVAALSDADAQVRKTAVWLSEPYVKKGDELLIGQLDGLKNDPSYDVRVQLLLSLHSNKSAEAKSISRAIADASPTSEMLAGAVQTSLQKNDDVKSYGNRLGSLAAADRALIMTGAATFKSLCATCHGPDGKGLLVGGGTPPAPPLVGSKRVNLASDKSTVLKILLHGLTGPVEGKTYADMPSMAANSNEWIAAVASYIRYEFGGTGRGAGAPAARPNGTPVITPGTVLPTVAGPNQGGFIVRSGPSPAVSPEDVRKLREETVSRTKPWTLGELEPKAGQ